jgi:stress response protein YsnF
MIEILRRRVVTSELHLTRRLVSEQREITETVRREEVDVTGPPGVVQGDAGPVPAS